jgi:hypothetical protein
LAKAARERWQFSPGTSFILPGLVVYLTGRDIWAVLESEEPLILRSIVVLPAQLEPTTAIELKVRTPFLRSAAPACTEESPFINERISL